MENKASLFFLISILLFKPLLAQISNPVQGFEFSNDILVIHGNDTLPNAWAGGLNSCQFFAYDLDWDGREDLVVFDRSGNRLLTFLYADNGLKSGYKYAPEYQKYFPDINHWMLFHDYNQNGRKDIFTYTPGGITVYENISSELAGIRFRKIKERLLSYQGGTNPVNIFASSVEMPAIADLSGDGCPDILVFHVLGSYVNMHKNLSYDLYGHCDSLIFERKKQCWGDFMESEESDELSLNIDCPWTKVDFFLNEPIRHSGSTFITFDSNGNGVFDLLLGDTDFPGLKLLINSGDNMNAHITEIVNEFPSGKSPVNLFSMPYPSVIDIDHDGLLDLIVSPFEEKTPLSDNLKSVWYYKNRGTIESPAYEFITDNFLQNTMIDVGAGAYPVLYDFTGNGLPDLFIGNYGIRDTSYYESGFLKSEFVSSIAWYENKGSEGNPVFHWVTDDFAGLSEYRLQAIYPSFGDLNNDGRTDMIIGESNGSIHFFENISGQKDIIDFSPHWNFQNMVADRHSTPQLIDISGNGLLDIVSGARNGKLYYFRNTGSFEVPDFIIENDFFGQVNVTDFNSSYYGYSIPHFFRYNQDELILMVGKESGFISFYKDIKETLDGTFTLVNDQYLNIKIGINSAVAVAHLTSKDHPDLIWGNYGGGLHFYRGISSGTNVPLYKFKSENLLTLFPNPSNELLNIRLHPDLDFQQTLIEIFDIQGQRIWHKEVNHAHSSEIPIEISMLPEGMFIVGLTTKGKTLRGRFIIIR